MTKSEMQNEALTIETLLSAMMTVMSNNENEDVYSLLDMAHERAR